MLPLDIYVMYLVPVPSRGEAEGLTNNNQNQEEEGVNR